MPETIREVLIRVSLKAGEFNLPEVESGQFETIQTELAQLKREAQSTQEFDDLQTDFSDLEKTGVESIKDVREEVERLNRELDKTEKPIEDARKELEDSRARMVDENVRIGESFKAAGEGAFTLARGVAFVSASSDEDFQKMVQNIAKVQGAFDIFKGSIETIKGVTEGVRAMRAASAASATANKALAASNVAVGTTATVATPAVGSLTVALGPIAIAAAAAGAAFLLFADDAEAGVGTASDTVDELNDTKLPEMKNRFEDIRSVFDEPLVKIDLEAGLLTIEKQFDLIEDRFGELAGDLIGAIPRPAGFFAQFAGDLEGQLAGIREQIDPANFAAVLQEFAQLEDFSAQETANLLDRAVQLERDRLSVMLDEERSWERQLETARQDLKVAEDRLRIEEGKLESLQASIGSLSEEDLTELRFAAKQFEEGGRESLTREQLALVGRAFGSEGRAFEQGGLAAFGRQRGAIGLAERFGFDPVSDVEEARRAAEEAQAELAGPDGLIPTLTDLLAETTETHSKQRDVLKELVKAQQDQRRELEEMKNGLAAQAVQ